MLHCKARILLNVLYPTWLVSFEPKISKVHHIQHYSMHFCFNSMQISLLEKIVDLDLEISGQAQKLFFFPNFFHVCSVMLFGFLGSSFMNRQKDL